MGISLRNKRERTQPKTTGGIPAVPEHLDELRRRRDAGGVSAKSQAQFDELICMVYREHIRYENRRI